MLFYTHNFGEALARFADGGINTLDVNDLSAKDIITLHYLSTLSSH